MENSARKLSEERWRLSNENPSPKARHGSSVDADGGRRNKIVTGRVLARDQSASLEDWQKLARNGEIVWFYNGRDRKKTGKIVRNGHFGRAVSESWLNPWSLVMKYRRRRLSACEV